MVIRENCKPAIAIYFRADNFTFNQKTPLFRKSCSIKQTMSQGVTLPPHLHWKQTASRLSVSLIRHRPPWNHHTAQLDSPSNPAESKPGPHRPPALHRLIRTHSLFYTAVPALPQRPGTTTNQPKIAFKKGIFLPCGQSSSIANLLWATVVAAYPDWLH